MGFRKGAMMRRLAIVGVSLLALVPQMAMAQDDPSAPAATASPAAAPASAATSASAMGSARTGPQRRFTGEDLFDLLQTLCFFAGDLVDQAE